jgi:hypothetical protein
MHMVFRLKTFWSTRLSVFSVEHSGKKVLLDVCLIWYLQVIDVLSFWLISELPQDYNVAGHQWLKPVILATWEDHGPGPTQANSLWDPSSKTNKAKMDWIWGSSSSVPAFHAWSPEFKPQTNLFGWVQPKRLWYNLLKPSLYNSHWNNIFW